MSDITDLMNNYRECVRNLWNTYFRMPGPTRTQVDAAFRFDHISELLFNELVLYKIGKPGKSKKKNDPWPFLEVGLNGDDCPALINRPSQGGGKYWDEKVNQVTRNSVLLLIDYFDFDEFNYIDYRYYRVKIISYPEHPELAGREALIETQFARISLTDEEEAASEKEKSA